MRGWTPGAVYLCGLGYSTAVVILVGTWLVQTRAEWPTIRGTEPILSSWPNQTLPAEPRAVKAAPFRSVRSSVSRINSFGETGLVSAQGETLKNSEVLSESGIQLGLETGGIGTRQSGPQTSATIDATLGRDRDFERESRASMRSDRSAHSATKPSSDYSAESFAALSRGVHHEPAAAALPGGRGGAYLYEVTAYSHGCIMPVVGAEGHARRAANGRWPVADVTVAADTRLHPFGTEVLIEGLGFRTVGDRGHAIKGRRLDLFVDSCREARKFGRRWMAVATVPPTSTRFSQGSAQ